MCASASPGGGSLVGKTGFAGLTLDNAALHEVARGKEIGEPGTSPSGGAAMDRSSRPTRFGTGVASAWPAPPTSSPGAPRQAMRRARQRRGVRDPVARCSGAGRGLLDRLQRLQAPLGTRSAHADRVCRAMASKPTRTRIGAGSVIGGRSVPGSDLGHDEACGHRTGRSARTLGGIGARKP